MVTKLTALSGIIHKSHVYSLTDPSSLDRITVLFGDYFHQGFFFCFQVINTSNEVKQSSVVIVSILGHLIKLRVKKVDLVTQMRNWLLQ